jgi:hypothetical protein
MTDCAHSLLRPPPLLPVNCTWRGMQHFGVTNLAVQPARYTCSYVHFVQCTYSFLALMFHNLWNKNKYRRQYFASTRWNWLHPTPLLANNGNASTVLPATRRFIAIMAFFPRKVDGCAYSNDRRKPWSSCSLLFHAISVSTLHLLPRW